MPDHIKMGGRGQGCRQADVYKDYFMIDADAAAAWLIRRACCSYWTRWTQKIAAQKKANKKHIERAAEVCRNQRTYDSTDEFESD